MKNKKYIIGLIIVVIVVVATVFTVKFITKNDNGNNTTNTVDKQISNTTKEEKKEETAPQGKLETTLKSTTDNPIQEKEVEAENIEIYRDGKSLQIITTLKNNSDKDINGFFIMMSLYDASGKEILPYAVNEPKTVIPAKGTYKLVNAATEPDNQKVVSAKITSLEINPKVDENENN